MAHSSRTLVIPTETVPPSNARLVAELQAVTLGIHLVGLDQLPEVMGRGQADDYEGPDAGMHDTEINEVEP